MVPGKIDPKAYAKLLARHSRMERWGFARYVAAMAAMMFGWMLLCCVILLIISGRLRLVVTQPLVLWSMLGCIVFMSVALALFQWILTHQMIRNAGRRGLDPEARDI